MSVTRKLVVDRTEGRMSTLEKALHDIEITKQTLRDNSVEVKSQIHAVVSRQLESLRNREVWLLGQVDVLEDTKEAVLRAQEAQMHRALGELTNSLEYSHVEDDDGLNITRKLTHSLDRLDNIELMPLESSHISFSADVAGMRQVIRDFGRIDSRSPTLDSTYVVPNTMTSMSLPHTFEDYGDAEHHILYKTLEDVKRERQKDDSNVNITVEIPRLGRPMSEWLAWTPGTTPTPTSTKGNRFIFPPFDAEGTPVVSIHQWLTDIKCKTEVEEDDFEVINCAGQQSVSLVCPMDVMDSLEEVPPDVFSPHFRDIHDAPRRDWLAGADDIKEAAVTNCDNALTETQDDWFSQFNDPLIKAPGRIGTTVGISDGTFVETTVTADPIEFENMDEMKLCEVIDDPVFQTVKKPDASTWLQVSDRDMNNGCALENNYRGMCSEEAGEHEAKKEDAFYVERIPERVQMWLAKPKSPEVIAELRESPLFTYFQTLPLVHKHWLASRVEATAIDPIEQPPTESFPVFASSLCTADWLQSDSTSSNFSSCCQNSSTVHHNYPSMVAVQTSADCHWLPSEESPALNTSIAGEDNLTDFRYRCTSITDEKYKWLSKKDRLYMSSYIDAQTSCLPVFDMPGSSPHTTETNECLPPLIASPTSSITNNLLMPQSLLINDDINLHEIIFTENPITSTATSRYLNGVIGKNSSGHGNKIWLQKKSLSVEEDDLDVPLMSETVAYSVSSMFAKMGLGHGPWLRVGDNYQSEAGTEFEGDWLLNEPGHEQHVKHIVEVHNEKQELFPCFQGDNGTISKWLSKSDLED